MKPKRRPFELQRDYRRRMTHGAPGSAPRGMLEGVGKYNKRLDSESAAFDRAVQAEVDRRLGGAGRDIG